MAENRNAGVKSKKIKRREAVFDGGGHGRRTKNWLASSGGPNAVTLGNLQTQRDRARDLARKVGWVASAIETVAADIIGDGIKPTAKSDDDKFNSDVNLLWEDFVEEADADGVQDLYGLQILSASAMIEAGECFARIRPRRISDGLTVPVQIQILEAEFVPLEECIGMRPAKNSNVIKQGIEFDAVGKRVAYWMYRNHPNDYSGIGLIDNTNLVRVPASEVCHLYRAVRPGQVRGIPWISSVILRIRDMLEYEDAEVIRKKTAAMFVAFVTRPDGEGSPLPDDDDDDEDEEEVTETALEAGTVQILQPGEEIVFSQPSESGDSFRPFLVHNLRLLAAAIGGQYEGISGDYSDSNFSTSRMSRMQIERRMKSIRSRFNFQFNKPIRKAVIEKAILIGALVAPKYLSKPSSYLRAQWISPAWPYANPKEEVAADILQISAGLSDRESKALERGRNVTEIDQAQHRDNERADKLGLKYVSDGRHMVKNPEPSDDDGEAKAKSKKGGDE